MRGSERKKGMTLLIAVLVTSIILAIGLSLLNITVKQYKISSASKDSVLSIYAADAGIECALLWDVRALELLGENVFSTSTVLTPAGNVTCFGQNLVVDGGPADADWTVTISAGPVGTTEFYLEFGGNPDICAIVTIAKTPITQFTSDTDLLSRGYNVPCDEINTSPVAVERAIRVTY